MNAIEIAGRKISRFIFQVISYMPEEPVFMPVMKCFQLFQGIPCIAGQAVHCSRGKHRFIPVIGRGEAVIIQKAANAEARGPAQQLQFKFAGII